MVVYVLALAICFPRILCSRVNLTLNDREITTLLLNMHTPGLAILTEAYRGIIYQV